MAAVAGPTQEASGELRPVASELPPELVAQSQPLSDGSSLIPNVTTRSSEPTDRDTRDTSSARD
jgi:hypothetical protein